MKVQLPYNQVTATNALITGEQRQDWPDELALQLLDIKNRPKREKLQEDEEYFQVLREELLQLKQARQQQRQEQAKRYTHAAQERMRIISTHCQRRLWLR
ncbi:actin-related protein 5-like [Drosophila montana]|uniref:actin-related protein 5-like n=1 Tax=Drosophila montana TaxID=40370 RepID=UPI00313D83C7